MITRVEVEGVTLLVKKPSNAELQHLKSLPTKKQYSWYLGLVVNKKLDTKQFVGKVSSLNKIINRIKEEVTNGC